MRKERKLGEEEIKEGKAEKEVGKKAGRRRGEMKKSSSISS